MRLLRAWAMGLSMLSLVAYSAMAEEPKAAPASAPAVEAPKPAAPAAARPDFKMKFEFDLGGKLPVEKFLADNASEDPTVKAAVAKLAARVDANKDGVLTMDEVQSASKMSDDQKAALKTSVKTEPAADAPKPEAPAAAHRNIQVKFEADAEGKVAREKFIADNASEDPSVKGIIEELANRADANKDGFLTIQEMQSLNSGESGESRPAGALSLKVQPGPDGKVSREQFLNDNKKEDPSFNAVLEQLFAQLDTNADGFLSIEEIMSQGKSAPATSDDEPEGDLPLPAIPEERGATEDCPYAVVISAKAAAMPEWKAVADALVKKHDGKMVIYEGSVVNSLPTLAQLHPRYTAFVVRPEVAGRILVARIHRLTRHLNKDPYTDTLWGIISAATPAGALRMAEATEPQVVHRAIGLTGINHGLFDQALTIGDAIMGEWNLKKADGTETSGKDGSADRTKMFVETFNAMHPDLIVGSGHATERNLEMSFSRGNTEIRDGKWYGLINWRTFNETPVLIETNGTPRVFLGAGNCLIGNFKKSTNSMAAALINDYGFNQFVGYTVPTWYGKGGWGTLNLWCNLPGTYSLAEAWFFNNQAITEEILRRFPASADRNLPVTERGEGLDFGLMAGTGVQDKDESGMLWDRDVVAFYGDPAQRVLLDGKKQPTGVAFDLSSDKNTHTLNVAISADCKVKGGIIAFYFPKRIPGQIQVTAGAEYEPLITENFIILRKADYTPGTKYSVTFTATP